MQLFAYWKTLTGTLANSKDPDEMQHNAAFHQGLHCLLRLKQPSETALHHNLENSTCDHLKYTMGSPILIVSICLGNSIRIQRIKEICLSHFSIKTYVVGTQKNFLNVMGLSSTKKHKLN